MKNLNPYNEIQFQERFKSSDICKNISRDFSSLSWTNNFIQTYGTPRQRIGTSTFSMVPFYYLELLLEKNPKEIYDLGCGWNIFKKYIHTIIGVGAENPKSSLFYADEYGFVDDTYVKAHQNYFESVFSINALHHMSLNKLSNTISDFISMVKSNGRGFITLNLQRMIDVTEPKILQEYFGTNSPSIAQYDNFVRESLPLNDCTFLIIDINLSILNDPIDGNIRLVFEKW